LVVGSDVNLEHPNWEQNWETAKALGAKIDEADPSLLKGIRVQKGRYNQHLSVNCVLLEVGTDLNTLDEAKHSAEWTAKAIYEYLQIQE
ncbi:MAG: stage II sporulation protein P, partial [Firmicutes bacterium]|nr:stage II sporulation protein P [Bacillota bacterium]